MCPYENVNIKRGDVIIKFNKGEIGRFETKKPL